mmetsp:Transcript_37621/g.100102  ORF Transcript_37621/g.100102 Transcript_37621/m.100102 type:complete len:202 (-) Transcript_37621:1557-2162(-)
MKVLFQKAIVVKLYSRSSHRLAATSIFKASSGSDGRQTAGPSMAGRRSRCSPCGGSAERCALELLAGEAAGRLELLDHVGPHELVAQLAVVVPRPHPRDHGEARGAVLAGRDVLRRAHQHRPVPLVLELVRVALLHRHGRAVHVQLADHGAGAHQLGPVRRRPAALSQAQQPDEDVLPSRRAQPRPLPPATGHARLECWHA